MRVCTPHERMHRMGCRSWEQEIIQDRGGILRRLAKSVLPKRFFQVAGLPINQALAQRRHIRIIAHQFLGELPGFFAFR
jgi:hypothetical protein